MAVRVSIVPADAMAYPRIRPRPFDATVSGEMTRAPKPPPNASPPTAPNSSPDGRPDSEQSPAFQAAGIETNGDRARPVSGSLSLPKPMADGAGVAQFGEGGEFVPRSPNYRVSFNMEGEDLPELVRIISEITGKRFIFGRRLRNVKATVFSPEKVTVAEAYQAFLSILETNGLTVVPYGRFLKIVETPGVAALKTPVYATAEATTSDDRYVTRIHRLANVSAEDIAGVLGKFKTRDGSITVYGPGNLLIITDTAPMIARMLHILHDIDVAGVGTRIWIEPVHYELASALATRLNEVFEVKPHAVGVQAGNPSAGRADMRVVRILGDDRASALFIVATEEAYRRIIEFLRRLDVPRSGAGDVRVLALQHADALQLAKTLKETIAAAVSAARPGGPPARRLMALTGVFDGGIKVTADQPTNSLVITSSARDYASLYALIAQLDRPRRQVFIDAMIMDLNVSRTSAFGVSYHGAASPGLGGDGSSPSLAFGGFNPMSTLAGPAGWLSQTSQLSGLALGVKGFGLPGSQNILGTGLSIPAFGTLISAMAATSDGDVLSTPQLIATDNVPAEINVGSNIPLQTNVSSMPALVSFGGAPQRQDIGTKIKITPHLNESNDVRLEVQEEISDTTGMAPMGSLGVQPFAKRTLNTSVVVRDAEAVVIGGLTKSQAAHTETKVPLLGDIPVLGALFRTSGSTTIKSALVLVVTPYILRDEADLKLVFERKMSERQEFLDHYFVFGDQAAYEPFRDYSRPNGLLEEIHQALLRSHERATLDAVARPPAPRTHEATPPVEPFRPQSAASR